MLHQNSLSALPEGLSALTALQTLALHENAALSVPPRGLLKLTALRELHIDDLQQHRFGPFWAPLMHAITVHPVERGEERGRLLAKADAKKLQKPVAMTATAPSAEAEARARAAEAELLAMLDLEGPGAGGASGSEQGKTKGSAKGKAKGKASRR